MNRKHYTQFAISPSPFPQSPGNRKPCWHLLSWLCTGSSIPRRITGKISIPPCLRHPALLWHCAGYRQLQRRGQLDRAAASHPSPQWIGESDGVAALRLEQMHRREESNCWTGLKPAPGNDDTLLVGSTQAQFTCAT